MGIFDQSAPDMGIFDAPAPDDQRAAMTLPPASAPTAQSPPNEPWNQQARQDPTFNPRDALWDSQKDMFAGRLQDFARSRGVNNYDNAELQDIQRWVTNDANAGQDASPALQGAFDKIARRYPTASVTASSNPHDPRVAISSAPSAGWTGHWPSGSANYNGTMPDVTALSGNLFNDPSTTQLEDRIRAQLTQLQSPIQDPARDAQTAQLQAILARAQGGNPQLTSLLQEQLQHLQAPIQDPSRDALRAQLQSALSATQHNPQIDALQHALDSAFTGLQAPVSDPARDALQAQLQQAISATQHNPQVDALQQLLNGQFQRLQTPVSDPARDALQAQLQQALSATEHNPQVEAQQQLLSRQFQQLQAPVSDPDRDAFRAQLQGAQAQDPRTARFLDFLDQQFGQLSNHPGFRPDELAVMNTQAFEPIEALRQASNQRELARTSAAGYLPTSGIANERMGESDRHYDQMRTQANRDLAMQAIAQRRADLNQALGIGQQASTASQSERQRQLGLGGQLASLSRDTRQENDARALQALGIGQQAIDLPQQQQTRALGLGGQLASLSRDTRQENDARMLQALGIGQQAIDLPQQQQTRALGLGGALNSLSASTRQENDARMLQALGIGQQAAALPQQQQARALELGGALNTLGTTTRAEEDARRAQALSLGTTLFQTLPNQQDQVGLQAANSLAQLSQGARQEQTGRDTQALNLSTMLQQLPRQAMQDALSVVNGSSPQSATSPFISLLAQQQQAQQFQQGLDQQRQGAYGQMIQQLLTSLFGSHP